MIGVFLCVYHRLENLSGALQQLGGQTFKDFRVHILNNSFKDRDKVEKIVSDNKGKLDIVVKHFEFNQGPMIRFFEAKKSDYEYVVFLDDDESFAYNMMEVFNNEKAPKTLSARVGANFKDNIHVRTCVLCGNAKYLGPGGMIADASIFRMEEFWKEWKPEFYVADDLWLSYFSGKIGWNKKAIKIGIVLRSSGSQSMLKNQTIRTIKKAFVDFYNWKGDV